MPRIQHSVSIQKTQFAEPTFSFQPPLFYPAFQDTVHAVFVPHKYTPGYAYPLIVWLHGHGSDERQLRSIMPKVSIQNYVAVAPRGVCIKVAVDNEKEGYGCAQDSEHIAQVERNIFDAIEVTVQKFNICRQRIFLAGYDTGGTMAFRVALSHPQYFAGVLSLCGALPSGGKLFGNLSLVRKLPIFLAVDHNSYYYPDHQVCKNLRLLHTACISITLRQYLYGHNLMDQMLADVNRWIMEQINLPCPSLKSPDQL